MHPKVYLAIDNCFAAKRWTQPDEWAGVIADMGVRYIECSADTELDPLYMGPEYLRDWPVLARAAQKKYGVTVRNLYSGHGTYSTLGLTHTDPRVRRRMMEDWFKPMIRLAAEMDAGMGFFAHCFPADVLADGEKYARFYEILTDGLAELNAYAAQAGCRYLAVEQMYSPNQPPFTISGTQSLLAEVTRRSGRPFYFTEDVGHHCRKYIKPSTEDILRCFARKDPSLWLGTPEAFRLYDAAAAQGTLSEEACRRILEQMNRAPWLFSAEEDADYCQWLSRIGCYSPIIHLQQTDGASSPHWPFTKSGVVEGTKLLRALKDSYDRPACPGMPEQCGEIYLTLEIFSGTAQTTREILSSYRASVGYWRQFIPADGMTLDQLTA